jgi:hypothetical protein
MVGSAEHIVGGGALVAQLLEAALHGVLLLDRGVKGEVPYSREQG